MDGVLNLNKPSGPTSHDMVNRVRSATGIRRVGHAGTLDPLATGVLVICIGRATRIVEYLMPGRKVYRAELRLGITTDTYDAEGEVISTAAVESTREQVETALDAFRGTIEQIPPMYSAVKHHGTPLHRLAREGVQVKRDPRPIEIFEVTLLAWHPPNCSLKVVCSSGTYVRTLAHDLGLALGCGAHLTGLTRLASGKFHLEDSVEIEDFERWAREGRWSDCVQSIDAALSHFPALHLADDEAQKICTGQTVSTTSSNVTLSQDVRASGGEKLARTYGPGGEFLALVIYDAQANVWRPKKVFPSPSSQAN
ncbi:MAG TPA: tRNA pseudouridine(55) synthase TruB [Chloroflexi bacterium]|nr:tRNA pseudouridine(55) synthase TruB [Chloroflexota bacterium]